MNEHVFQVVKIVLALAAGGCIGVGFGLTQQAAYRRYQKQQVIGKFNSGWAAMPGSMKRIANLLIALALIQLVCPMLFNDSTQWWVSGGLVAGYAVMLFRSMRERQSGML